MAKVIRQVNYILALSVLRKSETLQAEINNLQNSFYCIDKLAEALDSYLNLK
ncbi:hypothetical protein FLACHUCJ7_01453 [Flavobacterium chungangense]|uniref:Uncharacterized protein n=1 Tax=Flavobacterium chungangense TaxID=554283 RepID=A0A6V6YVL1_9FLAO|nr:hypothetical protein FLACHUCJ7_01453 [Flavobacterium chungangense]